MSALKTSSEKIFGPPTLESCAMAAIHFNNVETGDFLTPMLQKEVDAFRMLEGEFKVTKIDVEVRRADEIEEMMHPFCSVNVNARLMNNSLLLQPRPLRSS